MTREQIRDAIKIAERTSWNREQFFVSLTDAILAAQTPMLIPESCAACPLDDLCLNDMAAGERGDESCKESWAKMTPIYKVQIDIYSCDRCPDFMDEFSLCAKLNRKIPLGGGAQHPIPNDCPRAAKNGAQPEQANNSAMLQGLKPHAGNPGTSA